MTVLDPIASRCSGESLAFSASIGPHAPGVTQTADLKGVRSYGKQPGKPRFGRSLTLSEASPPVAPVFSILKSNGKGSKRVLDGHIFPKHNLTKTDILCRSTGATFMIHPPIPVASGRPTLETRIYYCSIVDCLHKRMKLCAASESLGRPSFPEAAS
jgi:hypothetical protein